jgi:hypothetical protein
MQVLEKQADSPQPRKPGLLWRIRWRSVARWTGRLLVIAFVALAVRTWLRYRTAETMEIAIREYDNSEYPEDPADRSTHFGQYNGRRLRLVRRDEAHFDFVFEPLSSQVATVTFRDVDVPLMTPSLPEWTKADGGLARIALTDRQWNRQQVRFDRGSEHLSISGGSGFEDHNLFAAELAKNCLNAGLWEVLLFTKEDGKKTLYYQGWFTFPLGHYKQVFEANTGLPYWRHFYYLEHWFNPAGTPVRLDGLRRVAAEREMPAVFNPLASILTAGEQVRKRRTVLAENVVKWGDFFDGRSIKFAAFVPPGKYSVGHPWPSEYDRLATFEKALWRQTASPRDGKPLAEVELVFRGRDDKVCRFLVGGFDPDTLPKLSPLHYPDGLYMPMGIGVPPFIQGYEELKKNPPQESPYYSLLLDEHDHWLNHHDIAVDGPVLHRDDAGRIHLYLLSYERHSLIAHFVLGEGP